jgi:hypothetical protein
VLDDPYEPYAYSPIGIARELSPSWPELPHMDLILLRVLFVGLIGVICYFLQPFGFSGPISAGIGVAASAAVIIFELRVRALNLRRLIGAVAGSVLGIFGASLFCLVLRSALPASATSAAIQVFVCC